MEEAEECKSQRTVSRALKHCLLGMTWLLQLWLAVCACTRSNQSKTLPWIRPELTRLHSPAEESFAIDGLVGEVVIFSLWIQSLVGFPSSCRQLWLDSVNYKSRRGKGRRKKGEKKGEGGEEEELVKEGEPQFRTVWGE